PDGLGHADYFSEFAEIQRRRLPLRFGVATVHRMGVGCGVSVSPDVSGVREPARQRVAGAGWFAGARYGSAFWRLLPAALDEFAASDLVGGDGGEPAAARNVWIARGRGQAHADIRSACSGGLDCVFDSRDSRGYGHFGPALQENCGCDYAGDWAQGIRRLHDGFRARRESASRNTRGG